MFMFTACNLRNNLNSSTVYVVHAKNGQDHESNPYPSTSAARVMRDGIHPEAAAGGE